MKVVKYMENDKIKRLVNIWSNFVALQFIFLVIPVVCKLISTTFWVTSFTPILRLTFILVTGCAIAHHICSIIGIVKYSQDKSIKKIFVFDIFLLLFEIIAVVGVVIFITLFTEFIFEGIINIFKGLTSGG